jgi:hypothetical protein
MVTARAEDNVLALSTRRLISDPSHARLSTTPVGVAPVGIQLFDHDRLIAVADSNRFTTRQAGSIIILDYRKALHGAGASATVGTFASGDFPRQWGLSDNGHFLYLTEFSSNILGIFPCQISSTTSARSIRGLASGLPSGPSGHRRARAHGGTDLGQSRLSRPPTGSAAGEPRLRCRPSTSLPTRWARATAAQDRPRRVPRSLSLRHPSRADEGFGNDPLVRRAFLVAEARRRRRTRKPRSCISGALAPVP